MDLTHPLDVALRERIKAAKPNQADFAKSIGRSAGWLNKYIHGAGNATVDDVVRILALLIGVEAQPLTAMDRRLLKVWRRIALDHQEDAVAVLETVAKGYRRSPPQESTGPVVHTPRVTSHKARSKR